MSSSISSSSGSADSATASRLPWGALWCVAFFVAAELACGLIPTQELLRIEQHTYDSQRYLARDKLAADYPAVNLALETLEPADVLVMGTSRAREAIHIRTLEKDLAKEHQQDVAVRNYATAAGRIDVSMALLERLIAANHLPRLLIIAADASDYRDRAPPRHRFRFTTLSMLPGEIRRNGWPTESAVTDVLGNSVPLRMALARDTLAYRIIERGSLTTQRALDGNAAFGGPTSWARLYEELDVKPTLKTKRRRTDNVLRIVRSYRVRRPRLRRLHELIARARSRAVGVLLCEIPISPPVREFPNVRSARERFRAELRLLGDEPGVWIWLADRNEDRFQRSEYLDATHLNLRGALRFTDLITPRVAEALAASADR